VIVFRINAPWDQAAALTAAAGAEPLTGLENVYDSIEFLMIQRRDSIGFVEIMRGKYKLSDTDYIVRQFQGMTAGERERLRSDPFEELWQNLWGQPTQMSNSYKHEKEAAKEKLQLLRESVNPTLDEIYQRAGPAWDTPEWGFPKGRRDPHESEYKCAMRELWEETNLKESDVVPINGIEPITETFFGSNQVHYCHKYYIAYARPAAAAAVDYERSLAQNKHMQREVGGLAWVGAEEALRRIRPDNVEKKEILLRVCSLLRNYCPLLLGAN
jgi:8-oxo-dGTP pyrophosphatase MutT (NUDIX family)